MKRIKSLLAGVFFCLIFSNSKAYAGGSDICPESKNDTLMFYMAGWNVDCGNYEISISPMTGEIYATRFVNLNGDYHVIGKFDEIYPGLLHHLNMDRSPRSVSDLKFVEKNKTRIESSDNSPSSR